MTMDTAILGEATWSEIRAATEPGGGQVVFFPAEARHYVVSFAPTANDEINVYPSPPPRES
jgi:hypothetical protein